MNLNDNNLRDATIIGYSSSAGVKIYFRGKNDGVIFLSLGTLFEFSRSEFDGLVELSVTASIKLGDMESTSASGGSPGPRRNGNSASPGVLAGGTADRKKAVFLLQNGDVKVNYAEISKVFTNKTFASFAAALETAAQNLKTYKRRIDEKEKALEPWKEKSAGLSAEGLFYNAGFVALVILSLADVFFLITGLFNPALFFAVLILTPVIILLFIMLPKGDRKNLSSNTQKYLDEDLLANISRLNFSKKTVEFFVILFLALFFMTVYFSKVFPIVYGFWKDYFGMK